MVCGFLGILSFSQSLNPLRSDVSARRGKEVIHHGYRHARHLVLMIHGGYLCGHLSRQTFLSGSVA